MDTKTVRLLEELNRTFYEKVARHFDLTRTAPWPGWCRLLPYIQALADNPLPVLDLGCGNGRFALFLQANLENPIAYHGVDTNRFLLQRAEHTLRRQDLTYRLECADIRTFLTTPPQPFGLVVLFGVLHHIPGFAQRRNLLQQALQWLAPQGLLVITLWCFYESERLRRRIVPWNSEQVPPAYRHLNLEEHDHLLQWRSSPPALRFCHYVNDQECARLLEDLALVTTFRADGANQRLNRYVVLGRSLPPG